jgi:thiamine-monophosphate kinase
MEERLSDLGEKVFLARLRARIPGGEGIRVGTGDDAALVETGPLTLVTTDSLVEAVHFRREWCVPRLLGRKALSINLSDVAAMGGTPRYALVSLCLPPETTYRFVDELYDGLLERAAETGVAVVGGNVTASTGPLQVGITLLGQGGDVWRRSGARPGDLLLLAGELGGAAAGLRLLESGVRCDAEGRIEGGPPFNEAERVAAQAALRAHLDPDPPVSFARAVAERPGVVHAAVDVSDGLSGDASNLAEESGHTLVLDTAALPVHRGAWLVEQRGGFEALSLALHGGEDYSLLLAAPPEAREALTDIAVVWGVPFVVVGAVREGSPEVRLKWGRSEVVLSRGSFDHFQAVSWRPGPIGAGG